MTTDFKIMFSMFFLVVFAVALLTGCRAPLVHVQKQYNVYQYGAEGNTVGPIEVLKEQEVSPTMTGAAIKGK